jgi:hypothetical protein
MLPDKPRQRVGRRAWTEADQDADRTGRVGLCKGGRGEYGNRYGEQNRYQTTWH